MKSIHILLFISILLPSSAWTQQFGVKHFRQLPNDISAYIAPVKDLNGEGCALVKVVCSHDFAFSTPLGIVQRRNEVGEVWLFMPRGTRLLTLKHPRWGVWRDFRFPHVLESHVTYELVIDEPVTVTNIALLPLRYHRQGLVGDFIEETPVQNQLPATDKQKLKRPAEPQRRIVLVQAAMGKEVAAGMKLIWMRRHGIYLSALYSFSSLPSTDGQCDGDGIRTDDGSAPFYSGQTKSGRWSFALGGVHRLVADLSLYEGIGYGNRQVAWETAQGPWLENTALSHKGLYAEAGLMYRWNHLCVSAGAGTITGKLWEGTIGLGWAF